MRRRSRAQKIGRPTSPLASYWSQNAPPISWRSRRSLIGPRLAGLRALRRRAGEHRLEELLEGVVHEAALVERRDHEVVLGVLDRCGLQQVFHEVAVGAAGPALEAGGGGDAVDGRRQLQAREVAVEARERVTAPGRDHRGAERRAVVVGGGEGAPGGEQGTEPVLLLGGRVTEVAQAVVEAGHVAHPRLAGAGQVGRPPGIGGCPPGARTGRAPSATAPARRCGAGRHGGRRAAAGALRPRTRAAGGAGARRARPGARAPVGPGTLVVGQERVVADRGGERALCQAEHHDQVEIEADAHLHGADEHAVAEPADATEVVLELELERAVEHLERHRALDGVEGTEAVQGLVDPLGRLRAPPRSTQRSRRASPPSSRVSQRGAHSACSLQRRGSEAAARRSCDHAEDERRAAAAPVRRRPAAVRRATRAPRRRARPRAARVSLRSACWVRRWSQSSPATTAASRDSRSHPVVGASRPAWRIGADDSHANTSWRR